MIFCALRCGQLARWIVRIMCRWCPALPGCSVGRNFLDEQSDAIGDPTADDDL